jgi:hypothetical protein
MDDEIDELDHLLDIARAWREGRYGWVILGLLFWCAFGLVVIVLSPWLALGAIGRESRRLWLKFRRAAADKLRPKDTFRRGNYPGPSDLVAAFVEYERLLVAGKETISVRSKLISELAHVEQELEEHRNLFADIRNLQVDNERPRRRDAILSTRARSERRRSREEREHRARERTKGEGGDSGDGDSE